MGWRRESADFAPLAGTLDGDRGLPATGTGTLTPDKHVDSCHRPSPCCARAHPHLEHGVGLRVVQGYHDEAWAEVLAREPDIAFLQECAPPPEFPYGWTVHAEPFEIWGSAIVTRLPMTPVRFEPTSHLGRFGAYLATATVTLPDGTELLVSSVHERTAPASKRLLKDLDGAAMRRPSVDVPWWNDVAWHGLADLVRGRRFIVAGDWNTSRWVDAKGIPTPSGKDFFDRAEAAGWVDLHQRAVGHEERSWFGSTNPRVHQPDVIFADASTAAGLVGCRVEPEWAADRKLSDHAPVIAELQVGHARAMT